MTPDKVKFGLGDADFQQAEWLAHHLEGQWRYDFRTDLWHGWNGHRWAPDMTGALLNRVAVLAAEHVNRAETEPERKALVKLLNIAIQERALEALRTFEGYGTTGSDWDQAGLLLGVQNGIVDLTTGKLIEHPDPSCLVTKAAGAEFDPAAPRPDRFLRFLEETYGGDAEVIAFMKRAIGALLVGGHMKAFLLLLGDTDTGKSTLVKVVADLLGDYAVPLGIKSFAKAKWQGPSNAHTRDLMRLPGSRFAYAVESDEQTTLDVARIKAMTGGEPQLLAAPYSKGEDLHKVTWKLWLGTNTAPKVAAR